MRQLRPDGRLDGWRRDEPAEQHLDGDEVLHLTRRNAAGWQAELQITPDGLIRASLATPVRAGRELGDGRTLRDDFGRSVLVWRPEQGCPSPATTRPIAPCGCSCWAATRSLPAASTPPTTLRADCLNASPEMPKAEPRRVCSAATSGARLVEENDDTQARRFRYDAQGRVNETEVTLKDERGQAVYTTTLATSYDPETGEPLTHTLADARVMRIERDAATGVARTSRCKAPAGRSCASTCPPSCGSGCRRLR